MGHPKFQRKKYTTPTHPWQKSRIEQEKSFMKEFGLKNKQEIWKNDSILRRFKTQVKNLIKLDTEQAKKEEELFRKKLAKYDLLPATFKLEDVLALETKDLLNLRLQTQVFKQGFAKTPNQARQFITHGHILINNKKIDIPSYIVLKTDKISFSSSSKLSNTQHPERPKEKLEVKTQLKLPKKKKEVKPKEVKKEPVKEKKTKKKTTKKEKVPTTHELAKKKELKEKKKK